MVFPRHVPVGRLRSAALVTGLAVLLVVPGTASAAERGTDGTATAGPAHASRPVAARIASAPVPRSARAGGRVSSVKRSVSIPGSASGDDAAAGGPGKAYVAFGDSYSSGPGLRPTREPGCGRSAANWASAVAATFGLGAEREGAWADYSCAGATAAAGSDVTLLDQIGWADRDGALGPGTEAVTFTAGGNDPWAGREHDTLYGALRACVQAGTPCGPARRVGPLGQLLPEAIVGLLPGGVAELLASVLAGADERDRWLAPADITAARMTARLRPAVAAIRDRAPRASIAVVGYPRVVPPAGSTGCAGPLGLGWGLEPGEVAYLDGLLAAYDRAQRAAVAELDRAEGPVRHVDLRGPSVGRDLCSGPDAWVNAPILAGLGFGGDSLHPSMEGMDEIAGVVEVFARAMGLTRSRP